MSGDSHCGVISLNSIIKSDPTPLTMGGVILRTVQTLLGHKDLRIIMRYFHLSSERLREAVQNLDKSFTLIEGIRENLAQQSVL